MTDYNVQEDVKTMMFPRYAAYGAIHALLAVALGAFAAHGLEDKLSADYLAVFETGVRYQMYHAIGLFLLSLLAGKLNEPRRLLLAGRLMHAGIILFSGSLYILSLTGFSKLGIITPFGGVAFIAAWALTAAAAWGSQKRNSA